jgi:hypothetical protein
MGGLRSEAGAGLGEAAWSAPFLGLLLGEALAIGCAPTAVHDRAAFPQPSACLESWSGRQWRSLPGIGPALALSIQREIWRCSVESPGETASALWLTQIPGIGPTTAKRVRRAMEQRSLSPGCPWTPAEEVELVCRHFQSADAQGSRAPEWNSWQAPGVDGVDSR